MSKHWIRMTHFLRSLCCSKGLETAKKRAACLLLSLMAVVPAQALPGAAESPVKQLEAAYEDAYLGHFAMQVLDWTEALEARKGRPLYFGQWVVHPDGFACRIPDGMESVEPHRDMAIALQDCQKQSSSGFSTTISVVLKKENESLEKLTEEKVRVAYADIFQRFELKDFERGEFFGLEGVRLSYLAGTAPRFLVQQYLFDQNGMRYTLTLTTENEFDGVRTGLEQFTAFCQSLRFCQEAEEES